MLLAFFFFKQMKNNKNQVAKKLNHIASLHRGEEKKKEKEAMLSESSLHFVSSFPLGMCLWAFEPWVLFIGLIV